MSREDDVADVRVLFSGVPPAGDGALRAAALILDKFDLQNDATILRRFAQSEDRLDDVIWAMIVERFEKAGGATTEAGASKQGPPQASSTSSPRESPPKSGAVVAPLLLTPSQFLSLDHASFRLWLNDNDLKGFEAMLPQSSDLKPADLHKRVFDTGPLGLSAILEDEVGASIRLSMFARIQQHFASAANSKSPAGATTSRSDVTSKAHSLKPTRLWGEMVDAVKLCDKSPAQRALQAELQNGREYTFHGSSASHAMWFAEAPQLACAKVEGLQFRSVATVPTARREMKPGFKIFFSGHFLAELVKEKRAKNASYVPVPGKLVDFATFWGIVGKAFSANKADQLVVDKALAKANSPDGLRAMSGVEVSRVGREHDAKIQVDGRHKIVTRVVFQVDIRHQLEMRVDFQVDVRHQLATRANLEAAGSSRQQPATD
ncbi:hypothetical protein M885DRAFT_570817, partial [Pelagophyceae sp. CCMP2097]